MNPAIAIVGMACRYADARSPMELWENVLAQRRAFRRMPPERLRLDDYYSADHNEPDRTYATDAALIEGYEFDRIHFRVVGSTFRSADLAHWLALDIAAQALADAGFAGGEGLPRDMTGVLLGNTLTGEFSRANVLRLRWPYVRRVMEAELVEEGWPREQRRAFLERVERQYKSPFPAIGAETLAGGLSNTIAGRICNHFDLKGGGYTIDGACASSLLAVATACSALAAGDLDVGVAGGVDLSLDPFELVGFAKTGALAPDEMRVYDARSAGFWPGEGCGFVVLMRHEDALGQCRRIYAVIRGWGISSDGHGGITRPEAEGQSLAVQRAYRRAGFGVDTVAYFEGHGTGTSVGDATELRMLSDARRKAAPAAAPATIGSVKANIGHTKAAAGIAGLIKATMALHTQVVPPTTGCREPHAEFSGPAPTLQVLSRGMLWPTDRPLRAGVSAMGFGGINTHVVLEGITSERRTTFSSREQALLASAQDAELLLLAGRNADDMRQQIEHLLTYAAGLSRAELADLAAQLERALGPGHIRGAVVASRPAELASQLAVLKSWLIDGETARLDIGAGVFLGTGSAAPRIGFLFPGQGTAAQLNGGALLYRFASVQKLYAQVKLPKNGNGIATAVAQPAIVTASLAARRVLTQLGITPHVAIGHSLGELTALQCAGAIDEDALLRIAASRGKAMTELGSTTGAMASIRAGQPEVERLLNGDQVVVACLNSPTQTVISGEASAVSVVMERAQAQGMSATRLPVSHAFHSSLVAAATPALAEHLMREDFQPLRHTVISTVTGAPLLQDADLRAILCRQVTAPVRFTEAVTAAIDQVDLLIEVGPGQVLSQLVAEFTDTPAVALDTGGSSLKGLLKAVGAAFVLGVPVEHGALFEGRFTRPFELDWQPHFFANPCELAPIPEPTTIPNGHHTMHPSRDQDGPPDFADRDRRTGRELDSSAHTPIQPADGAPMAPLDLIRRFVAERAELPQDAVKDHNHLLSDLHLNSITVGQIVAEAARRLGLAPPVAPTDYADATIADVAQALENLMLTGSSTPVDEPAQSPAGVDSWIRTFTVEPVERPLSHRQPHLGAGDWHIIAPAGHPLADAIREALMGVGGIGVVVCLPPAADERHLSLLLEGIRVLGAKQEASRFVLVQHGGGAASVARTLHLERSDITTCVVDVPLGHPKAAEWVVAEATTAVGYAEAYYDSAGRRWEPTLRLLPPGESPADLPLGSADVLLVVGGGKGITAECAIAVAKATGCRLALLGRARPEHDAELATNLDRIAAAGLSFRYAAADVTDAAAVQSAVRQVEASLGPVTGVLHGAARNVPRLLTSLDETAFASTLAPKVQGLHNVLAAVDSDRLRLLVTFGSIIARMGLPGEAEYALANEWLVRLTEQFQAAHPACRCIAMEWSIWSDVGMGARLGGVDALARLGVTSIPPDQGISILLQLLVQRLPTVGVVVAGRFGEPPTLRVDQPDLPFLRFLEHQRAYYPGVELIVDADLSADADPYLVDHVFQGERIFPAVMGLEAMAQVAMALEGTRTPPIFEDVTFSHPVVVPDGVPVTIRLAALVHKPGTVEVVLRSGATAFQVNHFRAICRFGGDDPAGAVQSTPETDNAFVDEQLPPVGLDPDRDLYGGLLFHSGRFKRVRRYRQVAARQCVAEIEPGSTTDWFGRYLPPTLSLGNAAARDAFIHAIQVCVPNATLLPIGAERIVPGTTTTAGPWRVQARERSHTHNTFTYDLEVLNADGHLLERWEGLILRMVASGEVNRSWVEPLLGPYIERRLPELIPGSAVSVVVERDGQADRRARSDRAIRRVLGRATPVWRRPDGKPEVDGSQAISAAHTGNLTLAVAGPKPIGCDAELVVARPISVWHELLGSERVALAEVITTHTREAKSVAATRMWAAIECLKKAGALVNAPLVLDTVTTDGWVVLSSGMLRIATYTALVRGGADQLVLAVLVRSDHARL